MSPTPVESQSKGIIDAFWAQDDPPPHHDMNIKSNALRDAALLATAHQVVMGADAGSAVDHGVLRWRNGTQNDPPAWLRGLLMDLALFTEATLEAEAQP